MNPELIYFLKINAGIALFYAFYRLFFYKDTFFHWRRIALLGFFILSLVYPLMNLQEWIKEQEPMVAMVDLYATAVLPEYSVEATPATDWNSIILSTTGYLYWGGVALLSLRFLIQLASIIRLHINSRTTKIQGVRVHLLKEKGGPFSFFHWIFVHPDAHTEQELGEIFTHELTHARQYHSVDVIFSEMMCIVCWFNPFAWLMKREVRNNLEYMADNRVIQTGHDYQSYQFHLLGLAHQKAAANLSNSFNVLPLKNRIKMMNKKRTKEIGRTKYLMFLPMAALLMIISNIEAVARTTKSIAREVIQTVEQVVEQTPVTPLNTPQTPPQDIKKVAQDKKKTETDKKDNYEPVFEVVENAPQYPGGTTALMEFLGKNTRYPEAAHKAGVQGRAIVQFVVEKDGSISNIKIAKSASPELDGEAIRVISTMPAWIPGKQRGQAVRVRFTVPVMFRLSGGAEAKEIKDSQLPEVVAVGFASEEDANKEEDVFTVVEEMPKYPGGMDAMMRYLARTIKYPLEAQRTKTEGRVIVQMIVDKNGKVTSPRIVQSVSPELDAEAIRIINNMPEWVPGKQKGKNVSVKYTLPIMFRLDKTKFTPTPVNTK